MTNHTETLEDLLCYLECARDNLLAVHCAIENGAVTERITLGALYGVHTYLDLITREMERHIGRIPGDVLRKAAEEARV